MVKHGDTEPYSRLQANKDQKQIPVVGLVGVSFFSDCFLVCYIFRIVSSGTIILYHCVNMIWTLGNFLQKTIISVKVSDFNTHCY